MTSGKKHILFFLFITILVLSVSCVTNQKNDQVAIVLEAEQKKSITIEESIDVENAYLQSPPEQISLQNEDASNGLTNTEGLSHDNGTESNEELNPNEEKIIINSIQAPQEYSVVPTHSDLSVSPEDTEAGVELENDSVISDVKFTDSSKDLDSVSSGDAVGIDGETVAQVGGHQGQLCPYEVCQNCCAIGAFCGECYSGNHVCTMNRLAVHLSFKSEDFRRVKLDHHHDNCRGSNIDCHSILILA